MKGKIFNLSTVLKIISAIILLVGLGSACFIYWAVENVPGSILGYEQGDGEVYPVRPDDSKKYLRDMELYGGKANVLMDRTRRWFVGLWQGKSLAFTLGCISILLSLMVFYMANRLPSGQEPDNPLENDRDKTD